MFEGLGLRGYREANERLRQPNENLREQKESLETLNRELESFSYSISPQGEPKPSPQDEPDVTERALEQH